MNWKPILSLFVVFGFLSNPLFSQDLDLQEMGFFGWSAKQDEEKDSSHKYFLVTGCARSGMVYTKRVLMRSGLKKQGLIRNRHWIVSPSMAVGYKTLGRKAPEDVVFEHIFHQVRNPLDVIASLYTNYKNTDGIFWQFVRKHVPEIKADDPLVVQCAKYWYYWNLRCEKMAEYRYRIEDIEASAKQFQKRLGVALNEEFMSKLSTSYHHWWPIEEPCTWEMLKREVPPDVFYGIQKMAKRYGYSTK